MFVLLVSAYAKTTEGEGNEEEEDSFSYVFCWEKCGKEDKVLVKEFLLEGVVAKRSRAITS